MMGKIATAIAAALLMGAAALPVDSALASQFHGGGGGGFGHFGGGGGFGHFGGGGGFRHFGGASFGRRGGHFVARHFAAHRFGAAGGRFGRNIIGAPGGRFGRAGAFAAGGFGASRFGGPGGGRQFQHGQFGWRNFQRGFVGWAGPVFWPYAYDDLFDYAFWPYDEFGPGYDPFWAYGYDDLFAGILLPADYAAFYGVYGPAQPAAAEAAPRPSGPIPASSLAQMCGAAAPVSGAVPIELIAKAVQPTAAQRAKLDALKTAEAGAQKALAASCATQMPATAVGRLDAVQLRLQDMIEAANIVSAPLGDFYASLNDEQKARFNALGETRQAMRQGAAAPTDLARLCGPQNAVPVVSVGQIAQAVQPDAQQRADLLALRDAANKADATILASCPSQPPLTPPGRLEAVRGRLQAMLRGIETVRPALQSFYASLGGEQKARFDAMSAPAASSAQNGKPQQ